MIDSITPCDRIMLPVYHTYCSDNGVRVDKEMFDEHNVIAIRWYTDDGKMHQRITYKPHAWRDNKNYFDPDLRRWKYG